ncbi:hypothetical protein CRP01_40275 [Flavilitoribacter nigricans DSM 23189 = NBRC 102662]|uniref:PNPLA domain-containing protein n=2 Tax=Flavilitoribacter TaxID=2762562 RepID=A0A2D0MX56_FLAN2|nr:hypothetical protein CRP01_40275 [Flavilitoribacter nigricans DSM 23189 = NBRC 102662]
MGGGVSLGTFSGAALTEILKLFILYGRDKTGEPYDRIVVDSFSGASAGAISLAILMRSLLDYRSVMKQLKLNGKELMDGLRREYKFKKLSPEKQEALLAAEVAQHLQKRIWVDEVDIVKLFEGTNNGGEHPSRNFGILKNELQIDLAKKYLIDNCKDIELKHKQILADRVLFACSLTNLLARTLSESNDPAEVPLYTEYLKATSSYDHKELRIIEFDLKDEPLGRASEDNWLLVGGTKQELDGNDEKTGIAYRRFNLFDRPSWAMFSASVVACGAFPVAFEPTVLERNCAEFPRRDSNRDKPEEPASELTKQETSSEEEKPGSTDKYAYVDGGTFNNEPIREAFRLAHYLDVNEGQSEQEDRLVIFVDPYVTPSQQRESRIFSFEEFIANGSGDGYLKNMSSISDFARAKNLVGTLITTLQDQGSIKEENKSQNYIENLRVKKALDKYIDDVHFNIEERIELIGDLITSILQKVRQELKRSHIPPGTRNIKVFLERYLNDCSPNLKGCPKKLSEALYEFIEDENGQEQDVARLQKVLLAESGNGSSTDKQEVIKVILKMLADVALDTFGKNENALRAAVTPVAYLQESNKEPVRVKTIFLPGAELAAFAGFCSVNSREAAFLYGRYCSVQALRRDDFRIKHQHMVQTFARANDMRKRPPGPFIRHDESEPACDQLVQRIEKVYQEFNTKSYAKDLKKDTVRLVLARMRRLLTGQFKSFLLKPTLFTIGVALSLIGLTILFKWLISDTLSIRNIIDVLEWMASSLLATLILMIPLVIFLPSYLLRKMLITRQIEQMQSEEIMVFLDLPEDFPTRKTICLEINDQFRNPSEKRKELNLKGEKESIQDEEGSFQRLKFKLGIGYQNFTRDEKYFSPFHTCERMMINPLKFSNDDEVGEEITGIQFHRQHPVVDLRSALVELNRLGCEKEHFIYPVLVGRVKPDSQSNGGVLECKWELSDQAVPLEADLLR